MPDTRRPVSFLAADLARLTLDADPYQGCPPLTFTPIVPSQRGHYPALTAPCVSLPAADHPSTARKRPLPALRLQIPLTPKGTPEHDMVTSSSPQTPTASGPSAVNGALGLGLDKGDNTARQGGLAASRPGQLDAGEPAPDANGSATGTGSSTDQSLLLQVLSGISDMQRELTRLNRRLDAMEGSDAGGHSPRIRPLPISRYNSYQNMGATPGSNLLGSSPNANTNRSPERTSRALPPPHVQHLGATETQPAPLLTKEPDLGLWCVVPAGGAGTRLWPLSRESYPKFLLDLTGSGRTLLQSTWDRLLPLCGAKQLMVVTGSAHVDPVMGQLPDLEDSNVFAEPSPKESMAAIGLAAAVLRRRDPEAVLGSFAADHIISGRDAFESAVTEAVAVAKAGYLVTIGIAPSHPSTGFGYIKLGESLRQSAAPNARKVIDFKEKPDARTASAYLATGDYRWNGGMFVVKAAVLMSLLEKSMPALHDGLDQIAASWDTPERQSVIAEIWPTLDKIAIDHAVAEPAARSGKVAVVPATFGWDDVGDFSSLADLLPAEKGEARILGDQRLVITEGQAGGLVVPAGGRPIACLGVDDVVVVDTAEVLLVTTRARAQDVKKMVARVKARDMTYLT